MNPPGYADDGLVDELSKHLSLERFWMENGFISDYAQESLFFYGGLSSKRVIGCEIELPGVSGLDSGSAPLTPDQVVLRRKDIKKKLIYKLSMLPEHIKEHDQFMEFWTPIEAAVLNDDKMPNGKKLTKKSRLDLLRMNAELNCAFNLKNFIKDFMGPEYEVDVVLVPAATEESDGEDGSIG